MHKITCRNLVLKAMLRHQKHTSSWLNVYVSKLAHKSVKNTHHSQRYSFLVNRMKISSNVTSSCWQQFVVINSTWHLTTMSITQFVWFNDKKLSYRQQIALSVRKQSFRLFTTADIIVYMHNDVQLLLQYIMYDVYLICSQTIKLFTV